MSITSDIADWLVSLGLGSYPDSHTNPNVPILVVAPVGGTPSPQELREYEPALNCSAVLGLMYAGGIATAPQEEFIQQPFFDVDIRAIDVLTADQVAQDIIQAVDGQREYQMGSYFINEAKISRMPFWMPWVEAPDTVTYRMSIRLYYLDS